MVRFLEKILFPSLISAQDFAYIEEAHGTFEMLRLIEIVFRYSLRDSVNGILDQEIQTMIAILELYRYRFGNFQYEIKVDEKYKQYEIHRYTLLEQLNGILEHFEKEVREYDQVVLEIHYEEQTQSFYIEKRNLS